MTKKIREADVLRAANAEAKRLGVMYLRCVFRPGVQPGWPDCIYFVPGGKLLCIEFKAPGGKPTRYQELRIRDLRRAGYDVRIIDEPDAAREAVRSAVEGSRCV